MLDAPFDLSYATQIAKSWSDNDTMQLMDFVICMPNSTNNGNIMYRCNQTTCDILLAKLYMIAHWFDIKKRYWERYLIIQAKSYQYEQYRMGRTSKYKQASMK